MKETILFLMAYPFWVKAAVVTLLASCALLLIVFKPNLPKEPSASVHPSVVVQVGVNQGGQVAGRDIVVNAGPTGAQTDELIRVFQARALKIHSDLGRTFKYVQVQQFLQDFDKLHQAHIDALGRNNLVEAHEYLTQIHALSGELERSEFRSRHKRETPRAVYRHRPDDFQRGGMIQWYAGKKTMELLVFHAMETSRAMYDSTYISQTRCEGSKPSVVD